MASPCSRPEDSRVSQGSCGSDPRSRPAFPVPRLLALPRPPAPARTRPPSMHSQLSAFQSQALRKPASRLGNKSWCLLMENVPCYKFQNTKQRRTLSAQEHSAGRCWEPRCSLPGVPLAPAEGRGDSVLGFLPPSPQPPSPEEEQLGLKGPHPPAPPLPPSTEAVRPGSKGLETEPREAALTHTHSHHIVPGGP